MPIIKVKLKKRCIKCEQKLPLTFFYKAKNTKDKLRGSCKICMSLEKDLWKASHRWVISYENAKRRCNNQKDKRYYDYGGRGIKFKLSTAEIAYLWKRDKADFMQKPSIDRINNDGHYEFSNCRFIELSKNVSLGHKGKKLTEEHKRKIGNANRKYNSICSIKDCNNSHFSKGLCCSHYNKWYKASHRRPQRCKDELGT